MELITGSKSFSGVYHWAWVCRRCDDVKKDELSQLIKDLHPQPIVEVEEIEHQ
jgi:hypothetical protein